MITSATDTIFRAYRTPAASRSTYRETQLPYCEHMSIHRNYRVRTLVQCQSRHLYILQRQMSDRTVPSADSLKRIFCDSAHHGDDMTSGGTPKSVLLALLILVSRFGEQTTLHLEDPQRCIE